jgi:hypothetical protein
MPLEASRKPKVEMHKLRRAKNQTPASPRDSCTRDTQAQPAAAPRKQTKKKKDMKTPL